MSKILDNTKSQNPVTSTSKEGSKENPPREKQPFGGGSPLLDSFVIYTPTVNKALN